MEVKMRKLKINILWKFLLSYIIVLLLPLSVIIFYYYPYSTSIVKNNILDWNTHITEQVASSMDLFMRPIYSLPTSIVANPEIKLSLLKNDAYQRYVVANEMKKYKTTDTLLNDTFLYIKQSGYLFSSTGYIYELERFMNPQNGYVYTSWSQEQFSQEINEINSIQVRPSEDVTILGEGRVKMITVMIPLPLGVDQSEGCVIYMIRHDTIERMMKSVSNSYSGDFIILDQHNNPIFSLNQRDDLRDTNFKQFIQQLQASPSGGEMDYDGEAYIASQTVSKQNGWKYISMNPLESVLLETKETQRNTIILVISILLTEIIIIYLSIRNNYAPIKSLVQFSRHAFKGNTESGGNEFDIIRSTIQNLFQSKEQLDRNVQSIVPKLRDNILYEIISGQYSSLQDMLLEAKSYGITFTYAKCTTVVINVIGDIEQVFEIVKSVELQPENGLEGYFIRSIHNDDILFISTHTAEQALREMFMKLQSEIEWVTGAKLVIGIGNTVDNPGEFHASYINALRTVEHLRIKNEDSILSFHDLMQLRNEPVPYPAETIQSLELFIMTGDVTEVQNTVHRLIEFLQHDRTPPYIIRAVFVNISTIILNNLIRLKHQGNMEQLGITSFHNRITVAQITEILEKSADILCELMASSRTSSKAATLDEVLQYIQENQFDINFSLQAVADHFGMSVSNFSHYFKKNAGQNFKDFMDGRRINHSKQLLIHSDETIDWIAGKVGYTNPSSFIRAFKKHVGVTPGQFRLFNK